MMEDLKGHYHTALLSGDQDKEREQLLTYFDSNRMYFHQTPADKLNHVQMLQQSKQRVMMLGDGLNDAGALKAAQVGVSITENTAHFSPASDVIMDASVFSLLPQVLRFSKNTLKVIHGSFVVSLVYNIIGLSLAVQGTLSPLFAAILMPLSSVTVIVFTTLLTTWYATKGGLK
jgi:Cu+-exporting ATPase